MTFVTVTVQCALKAIADTVLAYRRTLIPKKSAKLSVNAMMDTLLTNLLDLAPVQQTRISVARNKIVVGSKEASAIVTRKVLTIEK